jgi:N-acetylglucosamine-6-phosphate deacetylase
MTLTARRLITADAVIDYPVLSLAPDGTLASIATDPQSLAYETTTLAPAFLDIHTHGAVGHDVMSADPAGLSAMQRFLAQHGVAHYLPTTATASVDATLRALESLADTIEAETPANEAKPLGIHLEGPFLSHAKRGVHPAHELQAPSIALFNRFHAAARGHIALMTLAPEPNAAFEGAPQLDTWIDPEVADTALALIRHATTLGTRVSLGHSNATAAETLAAIGAGALSATHTFNAMRALDHREPGILGTVLTDDRLFAELICDGIHVAPALVRLWLRAKSPARAILVTDSIAATGMPDGDDYTLAGQHVTVAHGRASLTHHPATLAGSVLTLDQAVANLQAFTGCSLGEAIRCAAHNPAALLGRAGLTALAPHTTAHLNRFSAEGTLLTTYLYGVAVPSH